MDPQGSPDPTFRAAVEQAIAEDRPAILVSLIDVGESGSGRVEIAVTDSTDPAAVPTVLRWAAEQYPEGLA